MFYTVTLLLLCIVKNGDNRRMFGGHVEKNGEYSYVVKIGHRALERIESRRSKHLCNETSKIIYKDCFIFRTSLEDQGWRITKTCTGAVLNPKWTLTAGHCLPEIIDSKNSAVIQHEEFFDYDMEKSISIVEKVHPYPNTKLMVLNDIIQLNNDIGLLLHVDINLKYYGKLSAIETVSLFGQNSLLAGLGIQQNGRESRKIQLLDVVTMKCEEDNLKIRVFPSICAVRKCNSEGGICEGDSGGPLIHPSGIIGVSSLGLVHCAMKKTGFSGTMTAVAPFLKWIHTTAMKKKKES